jgi:3-hydroxyacyl-[acyl-carrier-protein] dehydratase
MKSAFKNVIDSLPYTKPFLFVDTLLSISKEEVIGEYTFRIDEYFYKGHFKEQPVTPGVILTECMAQIGLVCLAIYILSEGTTSKDWSHKKLGFVLSNSEIDFFLPVFPGEKVTVSSTKEYFRFQKLKCKVMMKNSNGKVVCKGSISGMAINKSHED